MIIVHDAAVGAYGHVDAGLVVVAVSVGTHVNQGAGLTASDAFLFTRDADGTAADADFNEVGSAVGQETEALAVHHVPSADLHGVAVVLADPRNGALLPLGIALGRVDAEHIGPRGEQGGHPLLVIPGIDAGADDVFLVGVQQFQRVFLVHVVILAEHHVHQAALAVDDRQGVELVIPDDVVGFL